MKLHAYQKNYQKEIKKKLKKKKSTRHRNIYTYVKVQKYQKQQQYNKYKHL